MHDSNAGASANVGAAFTFDLNLLASLAVLVREGNVTRAARALGISQPAMSHRLARLRERFDDPLLLPSGAGMQPTARALQLVEPVARGLLEFDAALRSEARFDPRTSTRRFTIACADFGDFVVLPRALSRLHAEAPEIEVRMSRPGPELERELERGLIDVAVLGNPCLPAANFRQRRVLDGRFATTVRADHPAVGPRMDLDTFVALPHLAIAPSSESDFGGAIDDALARVGQTRRVAVRVPSYSTATLLASRSDLVLTAPVGVILEATRFVSLRVFDPPLPIPPSDVRMVWHERWQREPGHAWLRATLAEVMTGLHRYEEPFEPGLEIRRS